LRFAAEAAQYREKQFRLYNEARTFFVNNVVSLIQIERFCMELLSDFMIKNYDEIQRGYNEASFLYPFWQNYPPEYRGRQPKGDPSQDRSRRACILSKTLSFSRLIF
jgi:hypothetical protein